MNHHENTKAQTTIEFTFCFILTLLLFFGCIMAVRWAGISLAERRIEHDRYLTNLQEVYPPDGFPRDDWGTYALSPLRQVDPYFHEEGIRMNLIYGQ